MTRSIDIMTLAVCLGLGNFLQLLVFFIQHKADPKRKGPGCWILGSALFTCGFAVTVLRDIPALHKAAIVAYNLSLTVGQILIYVGIVRFLGGREKRAPLFFVGAASVAAVLYFTYIQDDIVSRRICGSLSYALLCLAASSALLTYKPPRIAAASRYVAAIFMAEALMLVALAATGTFEELGLPFFPRPAPLALTFLTLILASWLTTIGLILLVNQKLAAESQAAEEDLRASKLFLQSVLNGLTAHIALIDANGDIILVNKAWRNFARDNGLTPELVCEGTNYLCACDAAKGNNATEADSFAEGIRKVLTGAIELFSMEYPCHAPHQSRWFVGRVTPFPGDGPRRAVVAHEDITERKLMELALAESNKKLETLSTTDALTHIANRRHFDETFASEYARHARSGMPLSIIMLDIDYFKNYNDTYGHAKGDECLVRVAGAIANTLERKTDLAARYGGEEFICLLPETDLAGAVSVAESIRQSVESLGIPHAQSAAAPVVTVSVGVLTAQCLPGAAPDKLSKEVDVLLYKAKANGRNRVESDGPPGSEAPAAGRGIIRILWNNAFACHHETIDRQHQSLIAKANEVILLAAQSQSPSCSELGAAIDAVLLHVAEHFRDEERILREIGFPGLDEHAAEHDRLLQKGMALASDCAEAALSSGEIIRYIVHDLIMGHMISSDTQYHPSFEQAARTFARATAPLPGASPLSEGS